MYSFGLISELDCGLSLALSIGLDMALRLGYLAMVCLGFGWLRLEELGPLSGEDLLQLHFLGLASGWKDFERKTEGLNSGHGFFSPGFDESTCLKS